MPVTKIRKTFLFLLLLSAAALPPLLCAESGGTNAEDIEKLVSLLGDPDWRKREEAQERLASYGAVAIPALRRAAASADKEQAFRAKELLNRLDPVEAAARVVRVAVPPGKPSQWVVAEKASFRGTEGRIPGGEDGAYEIKLRGSADGEKRIEFGLVFPGSPLPALCDLTGFRPRSWLSVEERTELAAWEEGVRLRVEVTHSVLLLWATIGARSEAADETIPLEGAGSGNDLKEALRESLLEQLSNGRLPVKTRLEAGRILSLLGEARAAGPLEGFRGEASAAVSLYRLGKKEKEKTLLELVKKDEVTPLGVEAALVLAEAGNRAGAEYLWKHLAEFSEYRFERAALTLAEVLTSGSLKFPSELVLKSLSEAVLRFYQSWQAAGRYLLHAVAESGTVDTEAFLSFLKKTLSDPTVSSGLNSQERTLLAVLKVLAARRRLTPEQARSISEAIAPHVLETTWREALTLLPYLERDGGREVLKPFLKEFKDALEGGNYSYYLRSAVSGFALLLARRPEFRKELIEILIRKAGSAPRRSSNAPFATTRTSAVSNALSILLGLPYRGSSTAVFKNLRSLALEELKKGKDLREEGEGKEYELFLWNFLFDGDSVRRGIHRYARMRPLEITTVRGDDGSVTVVRLSPPSTFYRYVASGTGVTRKSVPVTALSLESLGGLRRQLTLNQPTLAVGLFPESRLRSYTLSNLYPGERYKSAPGKQLYTAYFLRPVKEGSGKDLSWEEFVRSAVNDLSQDSITNATDGLEFFSKLKIKEAIPVIKKLFRKSPSARTALHLARLGDPDGKAFLLEELRSEERSRRLGAVRNLLELDPACEEAVPVLLDLILSSRVTELYEVTRAAARLLNSDIPERRKRALLTALAEKLTVRNASTIIPRLKSATGVDFGYYRALTLKTKAERDAELARIVRAWKRFLASHPADKSTSKGSERKRKRN